MRSAIQPVSAVGKSKHRMKTVCFQTSLLKHNRGLKQYRVLVTSRAGDCGDGRGTALLRVHQTRTVWCSVDEKSGVSALDPQSNNETSELDHFACGQKQPPLPWFPSLQCAFLLSPYRFIPIKRSLSFWTGTALECSTGKLRRCF